MTDRAILPPFDEILPGDWTALMAEGRERGVVHAERVAHVLRYVELTEEVITSGLAPGRNVCTSIVG